MARRPNILLIFVDQQRFDTIHAGGNPIIRTPQLDRLAREGALFSNAYTPSPLCVPARCSMIYGQYPHRTQCTDNGEPMPDDRPSLMRCLANAGYRTHGIGKMNFSPDPYALRGFHTREAAEPNARSIEEDDYHRFVTESGYQHVYDPGGVRGEMFYIPQPSQLPARLHPSTWTADRAIDFIRAASGSEPFFLFASFLHPHPPFSPPTPWNKLYRSDQMPLPKRPDKCVDLQTYINRYQNRRKVRDDGIDNHLLRTMMAYYYACISFVDYNVGRILAALEQEDRLDDTLILYTTDHGELLGDYNCFGKRSWHDASARIPLLARWPQRFRAGQVCDIPVSLVDIMPTCLGAADIDLTGLDLHGRNLAELTAGEWTAPRADRTVYGQFQHGAMGTYMATNRHWKYFYSAPDRREFLFDRVCDPEETRNCAGLVSYESDVETMRNDLIGFLRREGFEEPLDGNGWKLFPQPIFSSDSSAGRIRDLGDRYIAIPGYTD